MEEGCGVGGSVSVRGALKAMLSRRAADRIVKNKIELKTMPQEAKKLPNELWHKEAKSVFILKNVPLFYPMRRGKAYRKAFLAKKFTMSQLSLSEDDEDPPIPTAKEIICMNRIYAETLNRLP